MHAAIPNNDAAMDKTGHCPVRCLNSFHVLIVAAQSLTMEKALIYIGLRGAHHTTRAQVLLSLVIVIWPSRDSHMTIIPIHLELRS
jgi:hypothetical protein